MNNDEGVQERLKGEDYILSDNILVIQNIFMVSIKDN